MLALIIELKQVQHYLDGLLLQSDLGFAGTQNKFKVNKTYGIKRVVYLLKMVWAVVHQQLWETMRQMVIIMEFLDLVGRKVILHIKLVITTILVQLRYNINLEAFNK